jgi:Raf kinase inhibitor-like YbhB/YbcL family protein
MQIKSSVLLVGLSASFLTGFLGAFLPGDRAVASVRAGDTSVLAMDRILSAAIQPLYVSSPAFQTGQQIPDLHTAFGKNLSPPVAWDGAPPGTQSFVLVMEDSDSHSASPALHWLAYNIPASLKGLAKNVRNRPEAKSPVGMLQGVNYAGGIGYVGPNPPPGPAHHYHIEVFAMNRMLKLHGGLNLDKVIAAMNEGVLAEGEVVGVFAAPPPTPTASEKAVAEKAPEER